VVRLTVLGSCGAYPEAGQACSGYLVEHDGFRLLVDLGYAVVPRLFELITAADVDAVFITHGHPDHCADLNPLLRARVLGGAALPPLPVYALPGALDAVLALDRPGMLDDGYVLHELDPGGSLDIGPFGARTRLLPHSRPNAGVRLDAGGRALAYTGDTGPDDGVVDLARGADLLLAEASFTDQVPGGLRGTLSSADLQGRQASTAGAARLLLAHLMPGTDPAAARAAAERGYRGEVGVATQGLVIEL
jgi:ribonuclease BN (tRNA processing enzyme)